MPAYVCNVDTWGSSPAYRQGELIPDDCPYDLDAALKRGRIATREDYQKAHPDWDPEKQLQAEELARVSPGRELPTAADPPTPEAAAEQAEAVSSPPSPSPEAQAETPPPSEPETIQVQPPSPPRPGRPGTSGTSSS